MLGRGLLASLLCSSLAQADGYRLRDRTPAVPSAPRARFICRYPDKSILQRVIRSNLSKVQRCYEQQLRFTPALAGTVVVQFQIGPDGRVSGATGSGMTANLSTCVAHAVTTFAFPRASDGITVSYPFTFRPG